MEIIYELLGAINGIKLTVSVKDESDNKTINFIVDPETELVVGAIVQYLTPVKIDQMKKHDVNFSVK